MPNDREDMQNLCQEGSLHTLEEKQKKIQVNPICMAIKDTRCHYSWIFKKREIFLEELLEKYRKTNFVEAVCNRGLYIKYKETKKDPFVKKISEITEAVKSVTFRTGVYSVTFHDVLAYQKVPGGCYLLTADGIYSPTKLEEYGRGLKIHKIGWIQKDGIYGPNGECLCRAPFTANFIRLAAELAALSCHTEQIEVPHPLHKEEKDIKERYLSFLAARMCAGNGMLADWLTRMEIIGMQLDVPQGEVFDLAANALQRRRLRKISEEDFFTEVFSQLPLDMSRYGDMLYFDVLAFGLYTKNGKHRCRYSAFTEALEKELALSHELKESYLMSLEEAERQEFDPQERIMQEQGERKVMYQMIAFEAEVQKRMIGEI